MNYSRISLLALILEEIKVVHTKRKRLVRTKEKRKNVVRTSKQ